MGAPGSGKRKDFTYSGQGRGGMPRRDVTPVNLVSLLANGSIVVIGAPRAGINGVPFTGQVKVYGIDS